MLYCQTSQGDRFSWQHLNLHVNEVLHNFDYDKHTFRFRNDLLGISLVICVI